MNEQQSVKRTGQREGAEGGGPGRLMAPRRGKGGGRSGPHQTDMVTKRLWRRDRDKERGGDMEGLNLL
jgi:hypothetical protein